MRLARRVRAVRAAVVLAALLTASAARAQVPPDVKYLQFDTEHFRVIFPEGMEAFARRAGRSAEWAYRSLMERFIEPPSGRIGLVITDHTDRPNASATPIPTNRVVLIGAPSIAVRQLSYYTDWVDVTLAHEVTHIFHMDRADGIWSVARAVFGRSPVFFPAFYQPQWVIEGLATYYESRLTGAGRAYGSSFDMLLNNDASAGDFRTIDAADGLSPIWPAGNTLYAYGGFYIRDRAEQFGDSAIAAFARKGAARLPYTLNWASTPLFGRTLSGDWRDWSARFKAVAEARADSLRALGLTVGEPLSGIAWVVTSPRYSPDSQRLAFTFFTPRDDPVTMVIDAGTGEVVLRERRNGSGGNTWAADGATLYVNQVEFDGRYEIFSDLYAVDVVGGGERRLTRGGRLSSPDLAPDDRTLIAVETGRGTNRLVIIDAGTGERQPLTEYADGVNWERPRWAPDGKRIAVERWQRGRVVDVVVLDRQGELVWEVTRDDAADVAPTWSPDGRFVLWASDREGAHDIYAAEVPEPVHAAAGGGREKSPASGGQRVWRITRTLSGVSDPEVSPDGRWLAFTALHPGGLRVERIPYEPKSWEAAPAGWRSLRPPPTPRSDEDAAAAAAADDDGAGAARVRDYSPFPSLWPRSWLPLVSFRSGDGLGTFVGASTFGTDYVRRHAYTLIAGWRTGLDVVDELPVEGVFAYSYAGFGNPVIRTRFAQTWDDVSLLTGGGEVIGAVERERNVTLALDFLRPRVRTALSIVPVIGLQFRRFYPTSSGIQLADSTFDDLEGALLLGYSTARRYPRSVSAEKGFSTILRLEQERQLDQMDRWRWSAETVLRGYASFPVRGYANHIVAARLALGYSEGRKRGAELFELGGVPGQPLQLLGGQTIGGGSAYPVRGFAEGALVGDRIASASLEYRFPIVLVGRGYGLWPVLLDRVSAGIFLDAGSAWFDPADADIIASAGTELSIDLGLSYAVITRFRLGLARTIAVPAGSTQGWSGYVSAGVAF